MWNVLGWGKNCIICAGFVDPYTATEGRLLIRQLDLKEVCLIQMDYARGPMVYPLSCAVLWYRPVKVTSQSHTSFANVALRPDRPAFGGPCRKIVVLQLTPQGSGRGHIMNIPKTHAPTTNNLLSATPWCCQRRLGYSSRIRVPHQRYADTTIPHFTSGPTLRFLITSLLKGARGGGGKPCSTDVPL